jgi:membrane protein implicated in regulation of membrane protease activity
VNVRDDRCSGSCCFRPVLGLAVAIVAALAFATLDAQHRQNAYTDVVRLAWQFVVIVLLGALLTLLLDRVRERREERESKQELRQAYIRRLIDCSHRVE